MNVNEKTVNIIKSFGKSLSSKVDKSVFIGTVIQIIGVCKVNNYSDDEAFDIFQSILYEANFDESMNHDYLSIYINQVNNKRRESFHIQEFEKVIFGMIQESPAEIKKDVPDMKIRNVDYYETIARLDEAEYEERELELYNEPEEDDIGDTGILDGSFWNNTETITMAENLQAAYGRTPLSGKTPFIVNESSGEKIPVSKEVFSMGKDASMVDYAIPGNTTVSRKHAEIIKRGMHFFLSDKGSTNKTYVEGREIRPEEFVEIHNGTKFKLSNEEFTFYF